MTTPPSDDDQLRYLTGMLSGQDAERARKYFAADPAARGMAEGFRQAFGAALLERDLGARKAVARARLFECIAAGDRETVRSADDAIPPGVRRVQSVSHRRGLWRQYTRGAFLAGLLAAAVLGGGALWRVASRPQADIGDVVQRYATAAGQRATVALPDGSRVTLAPGTTIQARRNRHDGTTTITVDGQAFFSVRHRATAPFVVRTRSSTTQVLGTTFTVRQYANDSAAHIAVLEGRVAVEGTRAPKGARAVLVARMLGIVTDSGPASVRANIAVDDYTAWTTGTLVFRQTAAREIATELSRAYGVDIQIQDTNLQRRVFTWRVNMAHQSLRDVLDVLSGLLDARVVKVGDHMHLEPGGATPSRAPRHRPSSTPEDHYGR